MDEYKKILIDLVQKCKDKIMTDDVYVRSVKLLKKINKAIINDNPENLQINYDKIMLLSEEEKSLFTSPLCLRIIQSLPMAIKKDGITKISILRNIKKLEEDLVNNRIKSVTMQIKRFDVLLNAINNNISADNYQMVLDFIELSLNNGLISVEEAINLNFYVLRKYNVYAVKNKDNSSEIVRLVENRGSVTEIRKQLEEIFNKYGYSYDISALDICGGEENFVKYVKVSYVDYILAKFKRYGITQKELYAKKTFYNIVIDNDKATFNSMLDFVDHNDCSLSRLLYLPAIFSKRVREYVMKDNGSVVNNKAIDKTGDNPSGNEKNIKITGCNVDFLKNIELYKELKGVTTINDSDLTELGVYLSTPHELVKKNLKLLLKYKVVDPGKVPEAIVSLCGKRTEYLLDRFIESSIYEDYLLPRVNKKDEVKPARGTSLLYMVTNPLIFYKIKRAIDTGDKLFHANAGLKNIFTNDNMEYSGISIDLNDKKIEQKPMTMEEIDSIDNNIKKYLPNKFFGKKNMTWEESSRIIFKNLYKYKTFSPTDLFMLDKVTGSLIEKLFERDYCDVSDVDEETLNDPFIKILDNAVYCDVSGNTKKIKTNDLQYVFVHPSYPNIKVIISRYKVLRLCKLLKDNNCWIDENSSLLEKENTFLSILLKDSIVCEQEMIMIRYGIRNILSTGLIRVEDTEDVHLERRVVR